MPATLLVRKIWLASFTIWCLLEPGSVYGQFELRSATIVTQGDTLLGRVKYYDWDVSPVAIDFVPENGHEQVLPVEKIQRLVIAPDNVYAGRQLSFSNYDKEAPTITAALIGQPTSAYLLLELLLESNAVRFYRFFDSQKQKRYFLEKEGIMYPLDYIQTIVVKDNRRSVYENPLFRTTLKQVLLECPTLRTDELRYTETDIMNVLKEYHSYCRIDSRIYKEQQDIGKIKVSLGAVGGLFPFVADIGDPIRYGKASQIGVSMRLLLPRRFSNYFLIAELAKLIVPNPNPSDPATNLALYGGRYFGKGDVQGLWYTGLSIALGPLDTGVGLSYKKTFSISASLPVFAQLIAGFGIVVPPAFNFRYHLPLTK